MSLLHQNVYLLSNLQQVTIIQIHSDDKYTIKHKDGKNTIVKSKQFTQDKDLVIQLLHQDYQDSREAWWRLKKEIQYYKNKIYSPK
tara:strand:+ start:385 stop:642 length:258 start_codon:yes stop_codon:yes gene_type:complete